MSCTVREGPFQGLYHFFNGSRLLLSSQSRCCVTLSHSGQTGGLRSRSLLDLSSAHLYVLFLRAVIFKIDHELSNVTLRLQSNFRFLYKFLSYFCRKRVYNCISENKPKPSQLVIFTIDYIVLQHKIRVFDFKTNRTDTCSVINVK